MWLSIVISFIQPVVMNFINCTFYDYQNTIEYEYGIKLKLMGKGF